jgi:hypothetical protein
MEEAPVPVMKEGMPQVSPSFKQFSSRERMRDEEKTETNGNIYSVTI